MNDLLFNIFHVNRCFRSSKCHIYFSTPYRRTPLLAFLYFPNYSGRERQIIETTTVKIRSLDAEVF